MHQETLELAELKAAHALTPYPSDFEAFWKARMEEADNAPLSWQIVPSTEVTSTASAHFFDLTFAGIDGAEVYAKYLRPQTASGVQTPPFTKTRSVSIPSSWRTILQSKRMF